MKRVGRRIRNASDDRGWTQTELARLLDVADAQVSRWETGRMMPSPRYLQRIGEVFGVPAETFLLPDD